MEYYGYSQFENGEPSELPCKDKLAFDTSKQAQATATVTLYRYGNQMRVYLCRHCDLWHMTGTQAKDS